MKTSMTLTKAAVHVKQEVIIHIEKHIVSSTLNNSKSKECIQKLPQKIYNIHKNYKMQSVMACPTYITHHMALLSLRLVPHLFFYVDQ